MRNGEALAVALWAGCVAATPVAAHDAVATTLPILALETDPPPSIWHGLSVGTEVVAVSGKGGGGVGGDVFASYDHVFANNVVLSVRGATGYLPTWGGVERARGVDFAETDVSVGYDMGRLMPFVTAGAVLARPRFGGGTAVPGTDSLNLVMNGGEDTRILTTVGAGVTYALTDNLTVGVAVSTLGGRGALLP